MKICPQCKKHFEDTETLCPDCNVKLYKLKLKKKKKKKSSALKIILIIIASFVAFIVLGIIAFFGFSLYIANKIISSPEFASGTLSVTEKRSNLKFSLSSANQSLVLRYALDGITAKNSPDAHSLVNDLFLKEETKFVAVDSFSNSGVCDGPTFKGVFRDTLFCVNNFASYDDRCDIGNTIPCAEDTNAPTLYIDTNGAEQGPNTLYDGSNNDADIFPFIVYATKIVPTQEASDYIWEDRN